ncbi:MAG: acetyl-coenzyme A synthetase, partial [Thalassolituus sp. CG17_big_fil_post_rev_8_21_14_2_50_53_8]
MSDQKVYPVKPEFADSAWINNEKYLQMYQQSVINPEGFWREQAEQRIDWIKPFTRVRNVSFDDHNVNIKWFEAGTLNASANCLDRHLEPRGDQTAIIWEGDDPGQDRHITYKELHEEVSRFANALRGQGVRKGDIVCI